MDPRHFGMGSKTGSCFFRQWQTRKLTKNKFFLEVFLTFCTWMEGLGSVQIMTDPYPGDPKTQCHDIFYSSFYCRSRERCDTGGKFNAVHLELRKFQQIKKISKCKGNG